MSTEKSLLTFDAVKFQPIKQGKEFEGLYFPVGVTPCGTLEVAHLSHDKGTSHACVFGLCGSGKTKYVEFVLKALYQMYGDGITFHFLDGKGCEFAYWVKQSMPFKHAMDCSEPEWFEAGLNAVLHRVAEKTSLRPDLVVIDDASHLLCADDSKVRILLHNLYIEGSRKNVHILYASQTPRGRLDSVQDTFGLACATRLHLGESEDMFESRIASKEDGVRRYGDLTYSYNGFISRVRVPFCES